MLTGLYLKLRQLAIRAGITVHNIYDRGRDMKTCGCSLAKPVPVKDGASGATMSRPTHYRVLEEAFADVSLDEVKSFLDVGCAKGRIIAYLLQRGFAGQITGIELNDEVAQVAKKWTDKYDNVRVISGDIFENDLSGYDMFFMYRPFETPMLLKFLQKLDRELDRPAKLIYVSDMINRHFLTDRPGWQMIKSGKFFRFRAVPWLPVTFAAASAPQRYSVFEFDPQKKAAYDGPVFEELAECTDYELLNDYEKIDTEYCRQHGVYFDRTMFGREIPIPGRSGEGFEAKKCYK